MPTSRLVQSCVRDKPTQFSKEEIKKIDESSDIYKLYASLMIFQKLIVYVYATTWHNLCAVIEIYTVEVLNH